MRLPLWFRLPLAALALVASADPAEPEAPRSEIPQLVRAVAAYRSGESMQPLRRIEELIRQSGHDPALRRELESGLIALLKSGGTLEAKQFACEQLAAIGTEASLPALGELLQHEDTVALGCQALSTHASAKASEMLRQALGVARGAGRVQMISTLGDREDAAAVPLLARLTEDPDLAVVRAAILALGKIADEPARAAIAALRRSSRAELAGSVVEASMNAAEKLAASGQVKAAATIYEQLLDGVQADNVRRGAFQALTQLDDDLGEQRILETLRGSDTLLKPVAIAAIRRLRSEGASERLARVLPELQAQEQVWLIESLTSRPDPAARSAIEKCLASSSAAVRLAAIEAVGRSGDAASVSLLSNRLERSPAAKERATIEKALRGLPASRDVDDAIILELKRSSAAIKASLISVLVKRECRPSVPIILDSAHDADLAEIAFQALSKLAGPEHLPILMENLLHLQIPAARAEAENATAQVLSKIGDPAQRFAAVRAGLARTSDVETRCSLLRLLPACAESQALAVLQAAGADPNPQVRDAAIRALTEWPDGSAWDALTETLPRAESDKHRMLALSALVRWVEEENSRPDARLVERYRMLLANARTDGDRRLILGALGGAAHPEILKLAWPLLASPGVRAEAALAVRKIAEAIRKDHPEAAADALRRLQ